MTDDPLTSSLLQRVGQGYLDALTPDELEAHLAAGNEQAGPSGDEPHTDREHTVRYRGEEVDAWLAARYVPESKTKEN